MHLPRLQVAPRTLGERMTVDRALALGRDAAIIAFVIAWLLIQF